MKHLDVKNFGPIHEADIRFGDLTVLVGPQASGKSLFVQLLKAVKDAGAIRADLNSYGFDWRHRKEVVTDYCGLYFGAGMNGLVTAETSLHRDGKPLAFLNIAKPGGHSSPDESVFLIPAQRVMALQDGWPKPFMGYAAGDPYCVRRFSESVRQLVESGLGAGNTIFPRPRRLQGEVRTLLDEAIYMGATVTLERQGTRKQIVLAPGAAGTSLPYGVWSAGQREFTPLLLGLYWLMPAGSLSRRAALDTVVIEEPEMGLHPQAIVTFGLLVLELLQRGYKVIVSTHSPVILDLVWAIRELKGLPEGRALRALAAVFGINPVSKLIRVSKPMRDLFRAALTKDYRTYFFDRTGGCIVAREISSLDPGDDDVGIAGWGGLSGFSGRIAQVVGDALTAEST